MSPQKIIFFNKILVVIVIALVIYLMITGILLFNPKEYHLKISKKDDEIFEINKEDISPPLSYYKNLISGKLFSSPIATPVSIPPQPKVETPPEKKPLMTPPEKAITFKLIGIIWGEKGANALIKSSQESESQLVNIGDKISGYQVVDITQEAVILSKGDERKVVGLEE